MQEDMSKWNLGERFINELVLGGLRTNYGQGLDVHSFVGEFLTVVCHTADKHPENGALLF